MTDQEPQLQLWLALIGGTWKFAEAVAPGGTFGVRLRPVKTPRPLSSRNAAVLKHWLICGRSTVVAKWFGVSRSQVAGIVDASLKRLGFGHLPSSSPAILAIAARADADGIALPGIQIHEDGFASAAIERDDAWLVALTASEKDSVIGLLDGETRQLIGARRSTSCRTVANQLRAAFRKLKVSTVGELRALCARVYVDGNAPQTRAA